MTPVEQKKYFSTIEEYLLEKNVVTYKWLSRKCNIHSTVAKQLLDEFISNSTNGEYSVTYLMFSKDQNGDLVISLCDENDKSCINENIAIIDKQIYSIERNSSAVSPEEIYNDDKLTFRLEQMNLSSINYPSKIDKKPKLRRVNQPASGNEIKLSEEKSSVTSSASVSKVEPKKDKVNKLNFASVPKSKIEEKSTSNPAFKSPQKNEKLESGSKSDNAKTHKTASTGKGSLSSLFQNHRLKNPTTCNNTTPNNKKSDETITDDLESEKEKEPSVASKESSSVKNSSTDRNKKQKNVRKSSTQSKKKVDSKKRKRITAAFESSSEESVSEADISENEEAPEREQELEKPIEPIQETMIVQGKKRRRKVINKSVVGDDGFFYTDKEVVYESCDSDDNNENDPNVNLDSNKRLKTDESKSDPIAVSKKKLVPPEKDNGTKSQKPKTKQASIMNFFKKS